MVARCEEALGGDAGERPGPLLDRLVLERDTARAFAHDAECDAFEGENEWARWTVALARLAALHDPVAQERWLPGDLGDRRVEVELRAGGRTRVFRGLDGGDYVDVPAIVDGVNALVPWPGRRLRLVDTGDQTAFVLFADDREADQLVERGWVFVGEDARRVPAAARTVARGTGEGFVRWWRDFWAPFRIR